MAARRPLLLLAALAAALTVLAPASAVSGGADPASPGCAAMAAECMAYWNSHAGAGPYALSPAKVTTCDGQYPPDPATGPDPNDHRFFWYLTYSASVDGGPPQTFTCKKVIANKLVDLDAGAIEWVNKS